MENQTTKKSKKMCQHGKQQYVCRDCGGKGICIHNIVKQSCNECTPNRICEHGKNRYYCIDCGGKGTCVHRMMKKFCKDCGGSSLCFHGWQIQTCKECYATGRKYQKPITITTNEETKG